MPLWYSKACFRVFSKVFAKCNLLRKLYLDLRPEPYLAQYAEAAAVKLHYALNEGKPQPDAARLPGAGLIHHVKGLRYAP